MDNLWFLWFFECFTIHLWRMEDKYDIFKKFLKNGQNDHILGKMSKKAKIRQKWQKSEIWPKFAYFVGKMTFLDILPKNRKINSFSFYNIILSPKTPILGSKIEFLAIFKFGTFRTPKPSLFVTKILSHSFSLTFWVF